MKTFVETLEGLDTDVGSRIRARLPAEDLGTIESALPAVWLPMAVNVALTDATSVELGPESAHAFYRRMVLAGYETNTFKSFMATINRLFGLTPSTYVKMAPRGWELVFKNCGRFQVLDQDPNRARLEFTEIPDVCVQSTFWLESVRSSFYTAFDVSSMPGEIIWDELSLGGRRAVFLFQW